MPTDLNDNEFISQPPIWRAGGTEGEGRSDRNSSQDKGRTEKPSESYHTPAGNSDSSVYSDGGSSRGYGRSSSSDLHGKVRKKQPPKKK